LCSKKKLVIDIFPLERKKKLSFIRNKKETPDANLCSDANRNPIIARESRHNCQQEDPSVPASARIDLFDQRDSEK
jgi:hypothetical protein